MKTCSHCKIEKPYINFNKCKRSKDGVGYWCKKCRSDDHIENRNYYISKMNEYSGNNKEKLFNYRKEYYKKNKERIIKQSVEWRRIKRRMDPLTKLRGNITTLIGGHLRKRKFSKKSKLLEILGCSFHELQKHLIQTAINNYGIYEGSRKYHIDHVIPCASAKTEEELLKLNHYTNLQLLYPEDNLRKGKKYTKSSY